MDCFNYSCPFRENTSSSCNRCECVACQNRSEAVTYIASNRTLTETDIRALEAMKDFKTPFSAEKQLCLSCAARVRNFVENSAKMDGGDSDAAD